jgi:sulfocyanin
MMRMTGRHLASGIALGAIVLGSGTLAGMTLHTSGARAASTPVWVTTKGKVVQLNLIAGYGSANSGFNFDGAAHGQMTITIPLGDTVDATFTNQAQGAQHNAVVIAYTRSLPSSVSTPAFTGAATPRQGFGQGFTPGAAAKPLTFSFVANKTGNYMVVCGIAGHALAGMWDNLVVSASAKTASVTFGSAQSTTSTTTAPANPNQFVSTSGNVVKLSLIADYNNANAGFNWDGAAHGQMIVTVPLGAKIIATYKNLANTGHDVLIVPNQATIPTHSVPVAFTGASYGAPSFSGRRPGAGGPPSGTPTPRRTSGPGGFAAADHAAHTFTFVANKAGTYMIICGYPGHAIAGMWDTFVVSSTAKTASIAFK